MKGVKNMGSPKRAKANQLYMIRMTIFFGLIIALIFSIFVIIGMAVKISNLNETVASQAQTIESLNQSLAPQNKGQQNGVDANGASTPETIPVSTEPLSEWDKVSEKTCYLTFDDGPSYNTLKVLDILKQYGIRATFFVKNSDNLEYLKQIHAAGHTVALHTYSHEYSEIYASQKAYFEDLQKISDAVKAQIGIESKIIRFPGGSSNTVSKEYCTGIMTALAKETANQGYVYFDWNVDSSDASGNNVPASKILESIQNQGNYSDHEIVLMHDTGAKDTTVEALPQIIEFYQANGYTFAPITLDTPPVQHGINN